MNEEDSEKLSGMLKAMDYERTEFKDKADVIIFNTCCVRENAELKVHGNLGILKKIKKNNPDLIIAVCGCMMQQKGVAEEILKKYPHVDIVFGTHNASKFPEYLERAKSSGQRIREIEEDSSEIIEGLPVDREYDMKAFVTIMYGCDNFCTYCIVPYVRGREKSRKSEDIIKEIEYLVKEGYVEFTLLGQNVNSYGKGLEEDINFAGLLRKVSKVEGVKRIRFMTSHPKDLKDDVIEAIRDCSNVCKQIHLPVQSGSTRVLKEMNRNYTREDYLKIIKKIREEIKDIGITTDIIVGFPGETDEDFNETLSLCEEVAYDSAFTFIYSNRNNTPADKMPNQIDEGVKHERFNRLVEVVNRKAMERNLKYVGNTYEVLVEGRSKNNDEMMTGRTDTGKLVNFKGEESLKGTFVNVKIERGNSFTLYGSLID